MALIARLRGCSCAELVPELVGAGFGFYAVLLGDPEIGPAEAQAAIAEAGARASRVIQGIGADRPQLAVFAATDAACLYRAIGE